MAEQDKCPKCGAERRTFPILREHRGRVNEPHPPRIPWSVAELAYAAYMNKYGTDQSLGQLAQRGGFAASEMNDLLPDWRERCDELAALRAENKRLTAEAAELRAEVAATNMLLAERTARRDELVAENERLRKLRTSLLGDVAHIIGELLTWVDKSDEASDYASSCALGAIINEARSWERHFERAKRIEAAEAAPAEKEADHE